MKTATILKYERTPAENELTITLKDSNDELLEVVLDNEKQWKLLRLLLMRAPPIPSEQPHSLPIEVKGFAPFRLEGGRSGIQFLLEQAGVIDMVFPAELLSPLKAAIDRLADPRPLTKDIRH